MTARISSLPANGALYQYNGGAHGAQITALNTVVSDSSWRVIYNSNSSGFGNDWGDFRFKVKNTLNIDSSEGSVTVNVTRDNHAPTDIVLSNTSIAENSANGTVIGALTTTDRTSHGTASPTQLSALARHSPSVARIWSSMVPSIMKRNRHMPFASAAPTVVGYM